MHCSPSLFPFLLFLLTLCICNSGPPPTANLAFGPMHHKSRAAQQNPSTTTSSSSVPKKVTIASILDLLDATRAGTVVSEKKKC